mmetsp:Transcript_22591/g.49985  ORF Transcript_22591/g.49985 Transcript_22591/m.49985 type:complete len:112 (+) Transcript_22591:366-701(+)
MQLFCERPSGVFRLMANSRSGVTKRRRVIPTHNGMSVRQTSSKSMAIGSISTDVEKTRDADQDIVSTPMTFVTEVRRMASDTFPLAWVIIVTPEDNVVGTMQNKAMPCSNE